MTPTAHAMPGHFGKKISGTKAPDFDGTQPCTSIDLELFFPTTREEELESLGFIRPLCNSCAFVAPCLEWALANRERGIWAGTTDDQRRSILRKRNRSK